MQSKFKATVRHDMGRRRTLKKRNVLLSSYGVRLFTVCLALGAAYKFNKTFVNPPEYSSKEQAEKAQLSNKFGL